MAEGYSGSLFYSPACSPEPKDEEEPEIQQILEDMECLETAAEDPGTQKEEEDSKEDEDDTVGVGSTGQTRC